MIVRDILVAVDQFTQNDVVLARAMEIADIHSAHLRVVHVIDLPVRGGDVANAETLHGQAAIAARDGIEAALVRLGADTSRVQIHIEAGSPALRLIDICRETPPDLIVMRAHQAVLISESILGSTSDRIVAAGVAPVLIIRQQAKRPYAHVLLATNGTDAAESALSFTADLLPTATLQIVQAVEITPQLAEAMLRIGTGQGALTAHKDALSQTAQEHLSALSVKAPRPVTTCVLHGDPATELAAATRDDKVDLIAVGPGRASLIRRAFVGSVSRRLLRDAGCDVLICHQPPS